MIEETLQKIIKFFINNSLIVTRFYTVPIPAMNTPQGLPLGQGGCIAVYLSINSADTAILFGDRTHQEIELGRNYTSKLIFASDLSEIYVKPLAASTASIVQVQSYHWKWQK